MLEIKVPDYLENAFTEGYTSIEAGNNRYEFHLAEIGLLNVAEGKIIACDPFLYNEDEPFESIFPTGNFPVELAIAKCDNGDERVGFARIKFSDNSPLKWCMAFCEGQSAAELESGDFYGYGVDAGTGAFMDVSGGKELFDFLIEDGHNFEILIDEMQKTYKNTWSWLLWQKNGNSVAMFSSGWGDGYYGSYIGFDGGGSICRLVTDFGLLDWPGHENA